MACRYKYNGKWYTQEELMKLPEFSTPFFMEQREREFVNSGTAHNTAPLINYFPTGDEGQSAGVFVKFLQFKRGQLYEYQKRLNKIEVEKKKRDITTQRLTELNNLERELKLQIEGSFELGIEGIKDEITTLEKNASVEAVAIYIEKDLKRLEKLASSSNIDDLHEAQRIVDFYDLAGTFKRTVENPFFTQEEIFLSDEDGNLTAEYRLSDETMNQFRDWRTRAMGSQNLIDKRKEEVTINTINVDPSVKRTYGDRRFTFDEIVKDTTGLKDTDWISMWTMDITQGIFSTNGIIPQVMFSYLVNSFEKKLAWARGIEEKIDKMNPEVQKELSKLGHTLRGAGILGIKGASYQIFKEITKEGNETGGLVQRFIKEFYDEQSKTLNKFSQRFDDAKLYQDYTQKAKAYNKAFEELKKWRRNNTIILDVSQVPELLDQSNPAADAYKDSLVKLLGEKGYNEQVIKQKRLLQKYDSERQSMIDTLLIMENKSSFDDLSDKAKSDLAYWESNHDPKRGVEDYYSISGIFFGNKKANNFMDYNIFIPRKYEVDIKANQNTNSYEFNDTARSTGFHNDTFKTIEDNPVLSEFYDTIKEVCETIRENMPYELQQTMAVNTVPALLKTSSEIIADKNTGILNSLFLAFKSLSERIRMGFGVVKQSEISYAVIDPVTGKANYRVNDQFLQGNSKAVKDRMTIEKHKYIQARNSTISNKDQRLLTISRFTSLQLDTMNESELSLLAQYINVEISADDIKNKKLDAIRNVTGNVVDIGKYIRDFSLHSVVQSQTFDLAKIAKYYSNMIMSYAARQEALPILEIMKQHYESIRKPKTNNLGTGIYNANSEEYMKDGIRTNAIKQMDDWFERVALDNYGTKHLGPHGDGGKNQRFLKKINNRIQEIEALLKTNLPTSERDKLVSERERLLIKRVIPKYGKTIYSAEDKKKLGEIETLLRTEEDEKKREELLKIKEKLGKARTATAFFDNMLTIIRTMRLGYNISSGVTNFIEGTTSNMIVAASGEYFDPKEIYYGYGVVKGSFFKNISFGMIETTAARKNRKLMDKFNVIMDSKNELQKSSVKSYASKFSWLNPHELNQRIEFMNQSPIMIAMLRTEKVKSKTNEESTVWDAMTKDGHLKEEYRTEENIKNWEDLAGEQYLSFKQKLHKGIVLAHGNYDELRGMMIKSSTAGKALMMFKTWIPMQLYWRFASEQDDIQSGTVGFKGRYWSYGKGTGAVHGAVIGTALFGPLGTIAGGALGTFLGHQFGTDSGVGMLKESLEATKALVKKSLGVPVNLLAGRKLISTGDKAFEDWVGKGDFTAQDAKNLRSNMADITAQLTWLALILLAKGLFWDDEDKPKDPDRIAHNILVNKLMQLSSQGAMYINPVDAYKSTIGSNAVIQYLTDVGKEVNRVSEYIHGRDIIQSGVNAGESGLWNQTAKTFLPGMFKDQYFGFETQAERVFEESPFHPYFKSDATIDKEDNKRDRAERRLELKNEGFDDKQIRKILDEELPTPSKLNKLGVSREEYEQQRVEQE